jgi:Do/DeqQ family serine protease
MLIDPPGNGSNIAVFLEIGGLAEPCLGTSAPADANFGTKGHIPMIGSTFRLLPRAATAAVFALMVTAPAHAADISVPMRDGMPTLAPLVEKVTPAVVNIAVKAKMDMADNPLFKDPRFRRFFDLPDQLPQQERSSVGSGVIIDAKKGYILTNHHVIDEASDIAVTLQDKRVFTAKVIGGDKDTDVALLQIEAQNLTALSMGDATALRVGDYVVAVGNPFGLGQTVTSGIVSALGRSQLSIEGYEDFIQTDASINPGNSGGALVNLRGELIGINTAIIGPSGGNVGVGFAIPTTMVRSVMNQLIEFGEVRRGQIGVQIQDMTPELAKNLGINRTEGALIGAVVKGSPAEAAGLKAGDVAIELDGKPLRTMNELRTRIGMMTLGTSVKLMVLRSGAKKEFTITIGKPQQQTVAAKPEERPALMGATFSDTDPSDKVKGVRVMSIEKDSQAAAFLRTGDIIISVNRKEVGSVDEFMTAMKASTRQTALFVKRNGEDLLLIVP